MLEIKIGQIYKDKRGENIYIIDSDIISDKILFVGTNNNDKKYYDINGVCLSEMEWTSMYDLIEKCYNNFFKAWHEEYEHWADDEDAIREELHHNQYEGQLYYENGDVYVGLLNEIV